MKIGRGNRSSRRKPAPAPLCPPQIPLDQTRARKAFTKPTFLYSKLGVLCTDIKLTLHKALTYVCPTWEYATGPHLLKLQRRAIGNLDRCTPVLVLRVAFEIPYVCDYYMTKLCRTQAEVIHNLVNPTVRGTGLREARRRKYKRLKLGGGQAHDRSAD
jgi:hypothetical protein